MLTQLTIRGLAIIEHLSIDFSDRLNVITGETGAGKSILIKALSLLTGSKASADVVRTGFDMAQVTAAFHLNPSHSAHQVLAELGLAASEMREDLLIRRQVSAKGRSQAWVNDIPVTLGALRQLGDALIDIFAQHENHRFLDPANHLFYLDKFLPRENHSRRYQETYDSAMARLRSIQELVERYENKARERDYLSFRLEELRELEPDATDYEELASYCEKARRAVQETQVVAEAQQIIDAGFHEQPLSQALRDVIRRLGQLKQADPSINELEQAAHEVESQLNDMSYQLGRLISELEFDEGELNRCEERLGAYKDLCRKMGVCDVSELIEEMERLEKELTFLESAETELTEHLTQLAAECRELAELGEKLGRERRKAFTKVQRRIKNELQQLNMKGAFLDAAFVPVQPHASQLELNGFSEGTKNLWQQSWSILGQVNRNGPEKVHFLLAANPGESAKPLAKIASGGELSRIMLGIKKVLSLGAETCVMVFDEIDTGISGQTASIVGSKLKEISKTFQVICISHLAQVAAFGDAHFKVEKSLKRGRTESRIDRLSGEQSAEEIARLLSGEEITAPSLANARQLMQRARQGAPVKPGAMGSQP
jgi:DNA repair protein RecN (Recombination protein N)